jgi:porin
MSYNRSLGLIATFVLCAASLCLAQDSTPTIVGDADTSAAGTNERAAAVQQQDAAPIPANLIKAGVLAAKYDQFQFSEWEMPFPSVGDSLIGDTGGVREELAKKKIGFLLFNPGQVTYDFRQSPMQDYKLPNGKWTPQIFNGQRPTGYGGSVLFFGYHPTSHVSFNLAGVNFNPTWNELSPRVGIRLTTAAIHVTALNNKIKIDAGYLMNEATYYESYIAGNLAAGTLGQQAVLPFVVGENASCFATPGVNLKVQVSDHLYELVGVQRSLPPGGFNSNDDRDRGGTRFLMKGAKALMMEEFGYRQNSAPGAKSIFIRANGWYNMTPYNDMRSFASAAAGKMTSNNFAGSLAGDVQLRQQNPYLPFQGVYVGGTMQYAPPQQNLYHAYFETRAYMIGTFKNRPTDMLVASVNHLDFSQSMLKTISTMQSYGYDILYNNSAYTQPLGSVPYYGDQTTVGVSYGVHVRPGLWLTPVIAYTKHPVAAPRLPSPLWGQVNATLFW